MGSLVALLCITVISLIIVRVGATALMMTGMSWDIASFQSYSAFFGVGFTTEEAEIVVNHPTRRRIIRDLILAGNVGITSVVATLIVTFIQRQDTGDAMQTIGMIAGGVILLYLITKLSFVNRFADRVIRWSLERTGVVHAMDYDLLLRIPKGFCVSEIEILPDSPMADKTLRDSRPGDAGIVVLGILKHGKDFHGAPKADDQVDAGDILTVYGHESAVSQLS